MGWDDCHLHTFDIEGRQYGDRRAVDDVADENRVTLNGLTKSGVTPATTGNMPSSSRRARPLLRLCPVLSAPPGSADVHPRIVAALGAIASCSTSSPILLIQSTPNAVSGWAKTLIPRTSIRPSPTQPWQPASVTPDHRANPAHILPVSLPPSAT
jgi:hypothetical protein